MGLLSKVPCEPCALGAIKIRKVQKGESGPADDRVYTFRNVSYTTTIGADFDGLQQFQKAQCLRKNHVCIFPISQSKLLQTLTPRKPGDHHVLLSRV